MSAAVIIGLAVVVLVIVIAARSGGPRVTQIDRSVRRKKDSDDA